MDGSPRVLAFDTSSRCFVCGVVAGRRVEAHESGASPTAPSEGLLPMIHRCLAGAGLGLADIDVVVPGRGPGSFTGTRIALSTAKGIALGSGLPVVAVSSLEAAAVDVGGKGPVLVALDARKGEILLAAYAWSRSTGLRTLVKPGLLVPGDVPDAISRLGAQAPVPVRGDAPASYPDAFPPDRCAPEPDGLPLVSSPLSLARLGAERIERREWDDPDALEPLYSRPPPVHRPGRHD
jgi:tRNA threonylcarbamoyladenosine biosynthesis protein TsaB